MELFEEDEPGGAAPGNAPEFTVSEISGALKRVVEGEFAHVRVRGEVGRVFRARTGHLYFDLKDERNVLAAVSWKMQVSRLSHMPEEGMEVIATGRLTTFGPQSKYQMNVEDLRPAGAGALMAMLEKRKAALAAEGLFAEERKRPLPYLPEVIGVVTSPSGAVIRDILHRLRERFPRTVLVWPVAVQGQGCALEVARAIEGFNRLQTGGPVPRPDLLIVARGGGSIEDLWGFNEEIVARAAAASAIPLISAVGHETDTTLIDFVADRRAPTPTAAAEIAVPVRLDLLSAVDAMGGRATHCARQGLERRGQRLRDLARALPRPDALTAGARQRLDLMETRLPAGLSATIAQKSVALARASLGPGLLRRRLAEERRQIDGCGGRLLPSLARIAAARRREFDTCAVRVTPAFARHVAATERAYALLGRRLVSSLATDRIVRLRERLEALARMRETLGYRETLRRGYAVVRGDGGVVTDVAGAEAAAGLEIEFHDGRFRVGGRAARKGRKPPAPAQGKLL